MPNLTKYDEENFPSLKNIELHKRKKKFVVLDEHYNNRIVSGKHVCFCMGTKHPLVGNCYECGRVHCLQEGDKECIECGSKLIPKDKYTTEILYKNNYAKQAELNKETLLKYQKEFYNKMQIIDDYTDWYEISNNTWIDDKSRAEAKRKDEENIIEEFKV